MSINSLAAKSVKAQRELMASPEYARMSREEKVRAIKEVMLQHAPSANFENAVESLGQ